MLRRRWVLVYLFILMLLLSTALIKRHIEHSSLCRKITAQMLPLAETGADDARLWERYVYGESFQLPNGNWWYSGSLQGPAIYLLKQGYMDDALARAVLLTEARRLHDWQYTYASVYNYDLRSYLIKRCLHAYPDDLTIAWAAGTLSLAAGDDKIAVEQLGRIIGKREQWTSCVKLCSTLGVEPTHLLGRYCSAQTLLGRQDPRQHELVELLPQWWDVYLPYLNHPESSGKPDFTDTANALPEETYRFLRKVSLKLPLNKAEKDEEPYGYGEEGGGLYSFLRESDVLAMLMRSPQFASALKNSDRNLQDLLPELREATRPARLTYYDSANGELNLR